MNVPIVSTRGRLLGYIKQDAESSLPLNKYGQLLVIGDIIMLSGDY